MDQKDEEGFPITSYEFGVMRAYCCMLESKETPSSHWKERKCILISQPSLDNFNMFIQRDSV